MGLRCLAIALAFLAAFASDSWGQSKQPSPKASQQNSARQDRATDSSAVAAKVVPAEKTKYELDNEKEKQESDRQLVKLTGDLAKYAEFLLVATGILGLITAGLVVVGLFWVRDAKRSIEAAEKSAKAAEIAASAAQNSTEHIRTVERAYVKISHCQPGILFSNRGSDVRIEIKNYGATPARITNAFLNFKIVAAGESLPEPPIYDIPDREPFRAFLIPNDSIFTSEESVIGLDEIREKGASFCLFGYVDYVDVFGTRQRGGYARVYLPDGHPDNLGFITQDGYNYDRPRNPSEGNDWT